MQLCKYNIIHEERRGRKPGYIHEMGSHDLKSCEVKCHVTFAKYKKIKLKKKGGKRKRSFPGK
jgi:hypothetical protein